MCSLPQEEEDGFFMRKGKQNAQQEKKKSKQVMIEEIDSEFDETTPEKVMKKDKKFRPQRMA